MIRLLVFCALISGLYPAVSFAGTSASNPGPDKAWPAAACTAVDTFPNLNQPAPAGDDCATAPLFCGNYLNGYASTNAGATPDSDFASSGGTVCSIENNVWLRFPPCEAGVQFAVTTQNCQSGQGLEAALVSGDCGDLTLQGNCIPLSAGQTTTLQFNSLVSGKVYWLMIDGAQGDVCEFKIDVLNGIGTGTVAGTSCDCSGPSGIDGPPVICPGDEASYTVTVPNCVVNVDSVAGGNGYACPTPAGACPGKDSLVWHIPPTLKFVGDSTGYTVVLTLIDTLMTMFNAGLDTTISDSIWVEFIPSHADILNFDSLAFCDCNADACGSAILPFHITINHETVIEQIVIDCNNPVVFFEGQLYSSPGTFLLYEDNCLERYLHVAADFSPPVFNYSETENGDDTYTVTVISLDPNTGVFGVPPFNQNGPFVTSEPIDCGAPYTFTVVNFANGCSMIVNGLYECIDCIIPPNIDIPPPGPLNCCGTPVLSYTTNQPIVQTAWTTPNGQIINQTDIPGTQAGLYSVTVTTVDGCTASASTIVISDFTPPIVNTIPDADICTGQTATLNAGGGNQQYQWNTGASAGSVSVSPASTTNYTVTVTNPGSCCTQSATATVNVQPLQVVNLGSVGTITCDNPCIIFNGTTYCTPGDYQISGICTVTNFSVLDNTQVPAPIGLLRECNPSNTAYTVSFQIAGQPPFFINGTMISGNYYTSVAIPSGNSYTFIVKSGPTGCETTVTGTYSCDFNCLAESGSMSGTPLEGCEGTILQTTYLGGAVFGSNDVAQFALHTNPALMPAAVLARSSDGQFGFLPGVMTLEQPYYVSHIVGMDLGNGDVDLNDPCLAVSTSQSILFHAKPNVQIVGANTLCAGEALSLNGTGDDNTGQWVLPDGSTLQAESWYSDAAGPDQSGVYQYMVQNASGCRDTASTLVTVNPLPDIELSVESPPCAGTVGAATVVDPEPGLQFSLDGGVFQSGAGFKNLDFGPHSLKVQDINGCESAWPFVIAAPEPLGLDLGPDLEVTPGTPVTLQGVTNGVPVQTQWSTDAGESYAGGLSWSVQLSGERLITLEIRDASGCVARDEVWIRLLEGEPLYIPNVFSPQSEHGNTHFTVLCGEGYLTRIVSLRVFDRWGERVFERLNFEPNVVNLGWDGTAHNKELPSDVFAFITEVELFTGEKKTISGNVTLLR